MSDARAKFRQLTLVFDPIYQPQQDAADGPGASYVPETHEGYRKQLDAALDLNDNAKLLVAGQPGCGKTTLLLNMAHALRREGRVVAFVDLEAQTAVQDLDAVEMYLAALAELLAEASRSGAALTPDTLGACQAWLAELQPGAEIPVKADSIASSLRRQLAMVRNNAPLREELRLMVKQGSDHNPFVFLSRALDDLAERRPVIILDGLDKLPPSRARQTFLDDKKKPMAEAPGAASLSRSQICPDEFAVNVGNPSGSWSRVGDRRRTKIGREAGYNRAAEPLSKRAGQGYPVILRHFGRCDRPVAHVV